MDHDTHHHIAEAADALAARRGPQPLPEPGLRHIRLHQFTAHCGLLFGAKRLPEMARSLG
jgi:hypothetical protein